MANYMSEVAKMLGVELGEEFKIGNDDYVLMNDGLINISNNSNSTVVFTNVLNGTYTIKRKPWKPSKNRTFYFIDEDGFVCQDEWINCWSDIILYKIGNCYKTAAEAEKYRAEWLSFYKSDVLLEV